MKSTIGNAIQITIFGESHGNMIGATINGLCAGIPLDEDFISEQLRLRRPRGSISTARRETDQWEIVSGYFNNHTTGTPLTILIPNTNQRSQDYDQLKYRLRPSHADYTAFEKYQGFQDYRGGGHFSGRLTAAIVAVGAIFIQILKRKNILIATHIKEMQELQDRDFQDKEADITYLNKRYFPVLDEKVAEQMQARIESVHQQANSVGGILETMVCNMPAGIGEPMFYSIESVLSHLLFSIPAIKGVEFGLGFGFNDLTGSEANDAILYEDGKVQMKTNHNGGINGGISNGMPIMIRTVVKPTASIYQVQSSIDYQSKQPVELKITGRHDPAIVHRARVVVDSVVAIGLVDLFVERYGYQWLGAETSS